MCKPQKSAPGPEEATCHRLTLQGPVKAPIREAHFHVQHVDVDVRMRVVLEMAVNVEW